MNDTPQTKLAGERTQRDEIDRAYIRHYSDNGQTKLYIEWSDGSRTEGNVDDMEGNGAGVHMKELLRRAVRDGIEIEKENSVIP